ncbi:MAG: succinate dehydrogenase cytochrome b subunit [Verrucomicrobia bacterium]|nr:MAG: succinate dehydrogenase cytochrome b subunit [Verrucomicrobiota bacterium]
MNTCSFLFRTSLGKKYIMALTGLGLVVFVVLHLLGNLQFFLGREAINRYGHFLHSTPELLWGSRLGLLALVGLHLWAAIRLSIENRAARPVGYDRNKPMGSTYASRTMLMSGLIIAFFAIYHLLHFTVQVPVVNLRGTDFRLLVDQAQRHDVYQMMVTGFENPAVTVFYLVGVGLLCLHLSHGVSSLFQSLGLRTGKYSPLIKRLGCVISVVLLIGYWSIPLSVLLGLKK